MLISGYTWLSGTVDNATLSESQIAQHFHSQSVEGALKEGETVAYKYWDAGSRNYTSTSATYEAGGTQVHTHSFGDTVVSNNSNLPLYYALSYIIRIM